MLRFTCFERSASRVEELNVTRYTSILNLTCS